MCVCYNCSFLNLSFRWELLLRASPLAGQLQSLGGYSFWYVTVFIFPISLNYTVCLTLITLFGYLIFILGLTHHKF